MLSVNTEYKGVKRGAVNLTTCQESKLGPQHPFVECGVDFFSQCMRNEAFKEIIRRVVVNGHE